MGAVLGDLARDDPALAEKLHKEYGRRLKEYLEARGIRFEGGRSPQEIVNNVLNVFLEKLEFARLEKLEDAGDKGKHGVWRNIMGRDAYAELIKRGYDDPFLSCPLNAVIRAELERLGYTLVVHDADVNLEEDVLESWEEVKEGIEFLKKK